MTKNELERKSYWRRKENGLCTKCGKPSDGHSYCADCRQVRNERNRVKREDCQEIGLCVKCQRAEARPGKRMCFACAVHESELQYMRKQKKGMMTY